MTSVDMFQDPLTINLAHQTQIFLETVPQDSPVRNVLLSAPTRLELLRQLSRTLVLPAHTLAIASAFRPILLDLCARLLEDEADEVDKLEALCLLLELHPELFPILSTFFRRPSLSRGPLAFVEDVRLFHEADPRTLHRILLAYYRILQANRQLPRALGWPLNPLSRIIWSSYPDTGVVLLAIRCYALQARMMEAERIKVEQKAVGDMANVECRIHYGCFPNGASREIDGWILPEIEKERLNPLVSTPTTARALRTLALYLSLRTPTLLTSPPSSGKSLLLSHLAAILCPDRRNQIVTIHLADTSLDPRSLLGSYVSSPTRPGTFDWKEGVLVRAMREGRWVVFEDIDRGSNEVLGLLRPLFESFGPDKWIGARAAMDVPGRGRIDAAESFAVFATRSLLSSRSGKYPAPTFFGAHLLQEVVVEPPTHNDLRLILNTKFPRLAGLVAEGLIRLWEAVRSLGSTASAREVGVRELEKLCVRVVKLLPSSYAPMDLDTADNSALELPSILPNTALREDIFAECRDVFFGAGATTAAARGHIAAMSATIAEHLGLSPERRDWVLQGRIPDLSIDKDVNGVVTAVRVGHTKLVPSTTSPGNAPLATRPFAMHKPAISLLSRLATAISLNEPILLTGETGTGKTSVVTHLASLLRKPLISLNLSNQTESSDIIGGFKPVDARVSASELQARFSDLFEGTFSRKKNAHFEESVRKAVHEGKWKRAIILWKESVRLAREKIQARSAEERQDDAPRKRRKTDDTNLKVPEACWIQFEQDVHTFEIQHVQGNGKFAYGFVEGPLVKALCSGHWILLDEVNLASAETLECVSSLLHGPTASITLTEQGSLEPVSRHPNFRLFACMNPATDVGKKDLPPNIRSRFTEFDVPPPDADKETLLHIVTQYIGPYAVGDRGAIMDVAEFYMAVRALAERREIADGSNHRPHFSMRTLARALTFAADLAGSYSLRRALWEGCLMAFTMILDKQGAAVVTALAQKHILAGVRNQRSLLTMVPGIPQGRTADDVVKFGPFYLDRGPSPEDLAEEFIMTPSVETKLIDLARIIVTKRFPVLIEGPTSSGKTSSIEYLARRTGHRFVRINNHEHTDIQEYLGTYVSDPETGKLVFKDGLLVRALRNGDWIVLDELNLAPTDVLEALNRLLDDNRELVIPETQEVIRPHPHFMLFATQNPPGIYAGRKVLSRAFRNRFLEVHFEDVPQGELETILCQRCRIAPSYASRIVSVFQELQRRRQSSRIFESKHGFATLRDLFRWAGRDAISYQELADNGYMLLAERARREEDKTVVKEIIESIMKVTIDSSRLYSLHGSADMSTYLDCPVPETTQLVWTSAMQRLFTLVTRALRFNEPVLLVGETGCGKTSVCQLFAEITSRHLYTVNCHQNTETADLIGGLRPLRNRASQEAEMLQKAKSLLSSIGHPLSDEVTVSEASSAVDRLLRGSNLSAEHQQPLAEIRVALNRLATMFEWHDGPLVEAMRNGGMFLMDEISLADDSVLERLNSVLEPSRTIVLAERGGAQDIPAVVADETFKLVATMNPGGDYGKKELSPALRNRFTEIWVPAVDARADLELIVRSMWRHDALLEYTPTLLNFIQWLSSRVGDTSIISLRDILAWVEFSNVVYNPDRSGTLSTHAIFHHAAHMTFLDGLGSLPQLSAYSQVALEKLRVEASTQLDELAPLGQTPSDEDVCYEPSHIRLGSFTIPKGPSEANPHQFSFQAPTTRDNVNRVVRACQLKKPILLEGSPGVGKTSLVAALANICGYHLCRINLSDQTDLIDLFGSDLPVEGGSPGQFAWKDAEFLRALQEGHWVLLDEMNLAPQAVLEGLNAVLDHRGTVYIPELGRSFTRHPSFRIFAAQNPLHQGGGRKGLPKSFLNRFTKVYVQELSGEDVLLVCRNLFPTIPESWIQGMISYTTRLHEDIVVKRTFGREGAPWEFNLRDVIRWASQVKNAQGSAHPAEFIRTLFIERFRNLKDREAALRLFYDVFPELSTVLLQAPRVTVSPSFFKAGRYVNRRSGCLLDKRVGGMLQAHLGAVESISGCLASSWLTIVTGPRSVGKTGLVRTLANLSGSALHEIFINSATDASDILGSFEEVDSRVRVRNLLQLVSRHIEEAATLCDVSRTFALDGLNNTIEVFSSPLLATRDDVIPRKEELQTSLEALLEPADARGHFEWVDGPLVRALKDGSWLLLDGANLCNPSVLDRLNSLCESDGQLTLNERGAVNGEVETIIPHPNFRLFMSVDSQYGELSRAMRNRGVEVALLPWDTEEDERRYLDYLSLPTQYSPQATQHVFLPLLYEALRRGFIQSGNVIDSLASIPSGTLFGEDSTSVSMLDLVPTLNGPSDTSTQVCALSLFATQCVPPAHVVPLIRILRTSVEHLPQLNAVLSVLQHLPESNVYSTIRNLRLQLSESESLPYETALTLMHGTHPPQLSWPSLGCSPIRALMYVFIFSVEYHDLDHLSQSTLSTFITLLSYARYLSDIVSRDIFDYSAVHVVSSWLSECLPLPHPSFASIQGHVEKLSALLSLTSGAGLSQIWSEMTHQMARTQDVERIQQLDGLRHQIFELIALMALPDSLNEPGQQSLNALVTRLESVNATTASTNKINPAYIILELSLLSSAQDLIRLSCNDSSSPLTRLVHYQHAIWAQDVDRLCADERPINLTRSCNVTKHDHSMVRISVHETTIRVITMLPSEQSERTLDHLETYRDGLRRQLCLVVANGQYPSSRSNMLMALLAQCISMVNLLASLERLHLTKHSALRSAVEDTFLPIAARLQEASSPQALCSVIGESWIAFGRLLLNLYVPETPIDPAGLKRCSDNYQAEERTIIELQLQLHKAFARRTDGDGEYNGTIRYLEGLLSNILQPASGLSLPASRLDINRLHTFWSEIRQFLSQVLSSQKVDSYISAVRMGDVAAQLREQVLQNSLSTFCQRLRTFYTDFSDVSAPLQLALLSIRLGLRVFTHSQLSASSADDTNNSTLSALLAFPSVRSAELLRTQASDLTPSNITFSTVLARLAAISFEVHLNGDVRPYVQDVQQIYEQALGLWSIDLARQEQVEREAQTLYRRKDDGNLNEAEEEEKDFLSIFPEFEDLLDQDGERVPQASTSKKRKTLVHSTTVSSLFEMHQELFLATGTRSTYSTSRFLDERRALVDNLIVAEVASWPDSFDEISLAFQVRLLHDRIDALDRTHNSSAKEYDFYFDANVPERLNSLIREWPDQMVLQHIKTRCEAVMSLGLHSPLAKLLSAIEHLLGNIDDWEMYANRDNSLKAYQQTLIVIVVEWRRLELSSWQGLLNSQAAAFESGTSEWWFRLYDATIRGVLNVVGDAADGDAESAKVDKFFDDLIPLLDDFMTSSPLGQFSARLRLIESMQSYANRLSIHYYSSRNSALRRVYHILSNTASYYAQFGAKVNKSLAEQRKELEKNIRDFIKLASWKDVNIHALKQSAQKTHRQLYKVIRKFRDVLRQPVAPLLSHNSSDVVEARPSSLMPSNVQRCPPATSEPSFPASPAAADLPAHLINLSKTYHNFDVLIRDKVFASMNVHQPETVEDLATDIIYTSKALAAAPVPSSLDAARKAKLHKNLLTRKRKAWSDLMKELKRAGFSANVKPEILLQTQSKRYLREQPSLSENAETHSTVSKSEEYLHRISGLLPQLRQALSDHHSDLATRELQRAVMHIEHNFFVSLQTRATMITTLVEMKSLEGVLRRLQTVRSCPQIVCFGFDALATIASVRETARKLDDALRELAVYLQGLQRDNPTSAIPVSLIDEILELQQPLISLSGKLDQLETDLRASSYPLIVQDEYETIQSAQRHFKAVAVNLRKWSSEASPLLASFTRPVLTWLEGRNTNLPTVTQNCGAGSKLAERSGQTIDSLLIAVQSLLGVCPNFQEDENDERENYIRDDAHLTRMMSEKLGMGRVLASLRSLLEQLAFSFPDEARSALDQVMPFLERYRDLVAAQVSAHASWTKALFKLNYTLCSIVRTIAKDGFCQPKDTEGEEGAEGQETMEGSGLGEGTGDENVSKEIQDESQVEGLQGEDSAGDDKVERAEEGDAIEMSEDFGGDMQDVPEGEVTGEEESEDGSDADLDEQIGEVDASDENAVDEKLWGDEQGPEDKDDSGKTDQDHSKQQKGESEMVAKEGEQKKSEKEQPQESEGDQTQDQDQSMQDNMDESLPDEEHTGADGAEMDEHVQEADTLDLPDELQMDQDAQEQDGSGDVDNDLMDEEPDEEQVESGPIDNADQAEEMDDSQEDPHQATQQESHEAGLPEESEDTAVAQADTHGGDGTGSTDTQAADGPSIFPENAEATEASEKQETSQDTPEQSTTQDAAGGNQIGARAPAQQETQRPSTTTNPLRSLGDALQKISQRFNEILEGDSESFHENATAEDKPAQVEHVQNDDTEMQALGPARQDEVAKLRELNLGDDSQDVTDPTAMDVDDDIPSDRITQPDQSALSFLKAESNAEALNQDLESILTSTDLNSSTAAANSDALSARTAELVPKEEEDEEDAKLELEVREWQAQAHPTDDAEHIWRRYESLTHDLSYALCEQLRLILEPTQATRLKGDYRTGKRLNMKKIIPYIASEYTKDKIWLRRTRPSQREYQVLIALDDSRSMAESHSVHLAFQTLALVSKALTRLEVGDVGIAKFGQSVDVLHGFESGPFTDQAGAKIIDAFRFDQKATQVLSLLDTSLSLLEHARERRSASSSTAGDLWQMEIIISDGVCQDHERLRTVLRKAEEQRVMVVFIILDSLHSSTTPGSGSAANLNSIVSMNQVAYKDVNGRMDLTVTRYLDTFPFEYYVVVRDVEALPEVLSGTLKQFFERISEE
ncbi:hypothetical protein PHLGIDRAFT_86293 [Phlebiopsis gigantea 11061_1 CR5-6]|uniref:Midasin n=1 Tax=Phlebiopsis gigantea (strain 11061_1 CR5-6) TaxID=745531 RepID=A0A0C3PR86_PHLG1|nr:hypothetical protein PHLGIDRAFT_86293 [Phlebiopsis gigantea 11061_1 CR5-6]